MKKSIVIPTHNVLKEIQNCVESIEKYTTDYELIFVVDSTNSKIDYLKEHGIVLTTNLPFNFSHRVNMGLHKATGDYLCILNIDVQVSEGWFEKAIEDDKKLGEGLVGLRCQRGGGSNYDAHGDGEACYTNSTINMYGLVMSRRTYEIIGDLDQCFVYYGGEDDDYSLRALRNKLPLIISRAKVQHDVGCCFDPVKVKNLLPKTREVFKQKWGVELPLPPAENWVDFEREHITKPLISIVIPTRNHSKFISNAILSVLKQTYQNFQIIVGVDGKDQKETLDICHKISKVMKKNEKYYMVRPCVSRLLVLMTNEQVGSCDMRNRCVEHAAGEFIALLDSDDEMLTNRLIDCLDYFDDIRTDIVHTNYIISKDGIEREVETEDMTENNLLNLICCVAGGTFLMRKRCVKIEPFDEKYAQAFDFEYVLRTKDKFKFAHHKEPTIIYNRHDGIHLSGNDESVKVHRELIGGYNEKKTKAKNK